MHAALLPISFFPAVRLSSHLCESVYQAQDIGIILEFLGSRWTVKSANLQGPTLFFLIPISSSPLQGSRRRCGLRKERYLWAHRLNYSAMEPYPLGATFPNLFIFEQLQYRSNTSSRQNTNYEKNYLAQLGLHRARLQYSALIGQGNARNWMKDHFGLSRKDYIFWFILFMSG